MNAHITSQPLRVAVLFVIICLGVMVHQVQTVICMIILGQAYALCCRVPVSTFFRRILYIVPFVIFSFLFFPLYEPSIIAGIKKAALYSGRLFFVAQMLTIMFHQLSAPRFFQTLLVLKVPTIFIELIMFTLRFISVLSDEAHLMYRGILARGYKVKTWFSKKAYQTLAKVLGQLLHRALLRSDRVYNGMRSRGYKKMVIYEPFEKSSMKDKGIASLLVLLFLLVFSLDFLSRINGQ